LDRIPNAEDAIIDAEKLYGYILSFSHPMGRFKATVFQKFGYSAENWKLLETALKEIILSSAVGEIEDTEYGRKYIVEGFTISPSGKNVHLVTVWIILKNEIAPRFITVYPRGGL
jgi:hypothetical protein